MKNAGWLIATTLVLASPDAAACKGDPYASTPQKPAAQQPAAPSPEATKLFAAGQAAEGRNDMPGAIKFYERAVKAGHGEAASRLGDIYEKGIGGVPRNYGEALKWYNAARMIGEDVSLCR